MTSIIIETEPSGAMQIVRKATSKPIRTRKHEITAAISTRSRKLRIWSRVRDDDVSRMQPARDRSSVKVRGVKAFSFCMSILSVISKKYRILLNF